MHFLRSAAARKGVDAIEKELLQASDEDRKKAWKKMQLKWHPDKNHDPEATEVFQWMQDQKNHLLKEPTSPP